MWVMGGLGYGGGRAGGGVLRKNEGWTAFGGDGGGGSCGGGGLGYGGAEPRQVKSAEKTVGRAMNG